MQPLSRLPIHSITPIPWQVSYYSLSNPKTLSTCFLAFFRQQQQEQCAGKFKQLPLALGAGFHLPGDRGDGVYGEPGERHVSMMYLPLSHSLAPCEV